MPGREADSRRTAFLATVALVSGVAFLALAAVFWVTTSSRGSAGAIPGWFDVSVLAGWQVLPVATLAVALVLAATGRPSAGRFVLISVVGAGVLMYAARIVLQAVGADEDGGRLSDFPSGHATSVTAFAGGLAAVYWLESRRATMRFLAAAFSIGASIVVGWARVAGHGHSVLDVVGGISLAIFWLALCLLVVPPDRARTFSRAQILVVVLVVGSAGFVFVSLLYPYEPLVSGDADVVRWVASTVPGWADTSARAAGDLGTWSAWIVGAGLTILLLALRRLRDAVWVAATFVGIQLLTATLKDLFDRPRPQGVSAIPLPGSPSFPSGHATTAVVTFGVLAALAAERWPALRYPLWALAAVATLAIGTSRVVLDVHYVTDVVAGWCLGLAWLAAALLVRDALVPRAAELPVSSRARSSEGIVAG